MIPKFLLFFLAHLFVLIDKLGYLGLFIVSLVSSSVLILIPSPLPAFIFTMGARLNPFLIAIIASLGTTIGGSTKYLLGLGGKELLEKKYENEMSRVRDAFEKYNFFWWIVAVGLTPFPDDPISIFCGMVKYDFKKYFIAMFIGRLILNFIIALAGYYSMTSLMSLLDISI